jgi:hypothetical protein
MPKGMMARTWERVRSLCAQLFAGVPQDSTKEKGHNVGTKGQLEGGIPAVLKGHGEADYRYFRTENETRSLHHYVYSLFEERLVDRGMVTEVEDDFDITQWNEDFFHDGRFIRVVGLVRLMDYAWVSTMMEALPEMMRAAQHAENISLKERLAAQEISKREYEAQQKEQQKQLHELKSLKLDKMTGLVRPALRRCGPRKSGAGQVSPQQRFRRLGRSRALSRFCGFVESEVRV